jgi:hypothetical protein
MAEQLILIRRADETRSAWARLKKSKFARRLRWAMVTP